MAANDSRLLWGTCTRCNSNLRRFSLKTFFKWFDYLHILECQNCKLKYETPYWVFFLFTVIFLTLALAILQYLTENKYGHFPKISLGLLSTYLLGVTCPVRKLHE